MSNIRYCRSCKHYKHDNPKHPYGWGLCKMLNERRPHDICCEIEPSLSRPVNKGAYIEYLDIINHRRI